MGRSDGAGCIAPLRGPNQLGEVSEGDPISAKVTRGAWAFLSGAVLQICAPTRIESMPRARTALGFLRGAGVAPANPISRAGFPGAPESLFGANRPSSLCGAYVEMWNYTGNVTLPGYGELAGYVIFVLLLLQFFYFLLLAISGSK